MYRLPRRLTLTQRLLRHALLAIASAVAAALFWAFLAFAFSF